MDCNAEYASPEGRESPPGSSDDAERDSDGTNCFSSPPNQSTPFGDSEPEPKPEPTRRRVVLQSEEMLFQSHALGCLRAKTSDSTELVDERFYCHLSVREDRHLAVRNAAYLD